MAARSNSDSACICIVGLGGLGAEVMKKVKTVRRFRGRPVSAIIAIDYFASEERREATRSDLAKHFQRVHVFAWDATKFESTVKLEQDLTATLTDGLKVDALLVTTGMGYHGSTRNTPLEMTNAAMNKLFQVNCNGPALVSQLIASKFMRCPPAGDATVVSEAMRPVILFMSSVSGLMGLPDRAAYCASKFALNGFAESLYADMPHLRIVLICPSTVNTGFRDNWKKQLATAPDAVNSHATAAALQPKSFLSSLWTKASDGKTDMTVEACVAGIWSALESPKAGAGVQYMPMGSTLMRLCIWLVRAGVADEYARYRAVLKTSKM